MVSGLNNFQTRKSFRVQISQNTVVISFIRKTIVLKFVHINIDAPKKVKSPKYAIKRRAEQGRLKLKQVESVCTCT